ncbi:MAG: T9SS type A sorting domain-containing protein [Dysgonamonadaceae bacterium]|jgi:hypothetical protein|nr:T9SS type A sorting domain-containing protein [Dysgonamonadaceae bacterium]
MKKVFFTILLLGSILSASANDVYVSATGSDTNDGTSAVAAFATFGKALTAVEDGGTVHVSGFLYACDDEANPLPADDFNKSGYPVTKSVTVQGANKTADGFIGFNEATYNASRFFSVNNGGTLTLKNLTLKDGVGTNKGGAVHVNGGALIAENVIFEACTAEGDNQPSGGAIHVDRTTYVGFKSCLFKGNSTAKGGAFYIQDTGNPNVELRFEACSFVGNRSTQGGASCGGLFFRLMAENLTINIINSTFSGNSNAGNGGTIYVYGAQASNQFNIVNTTVVDNIGRSGGGSGAGINVELQSDEARKPIIHIQNSIIEGNASGDATTAEDLVYGYAPTVDKLQVSNSFIGKVYVAGAQEIPTDCYAETLYWDYMTRAFDRSEVLSGIDAFDSNYNVYPLMTGATALNYGKASFLQEIGITTDQLGSTRTFADGKCSAGATEGIGLPTGIRTLKLAEKINLYQSGDNLHVSAAGQDALTVELISISGQIVTKQSGAGEINLPVNHLKGVYVAKISVAGDVYTKKLIVK